MNSPPVAPTASRLLWLDVVRAVSIIAVVFGHVVADPAVRYVFLWRMPLFFFVAGYVFTPSPRLEQFARDKALRLLVPYLVFLVPLSVPDFVATVRLGTPHDWLLFAMSHVSGGKSVYGWLVAVWFVTCLYVTLQMVNFGITRLSPRAMNSAMGASLVLAYVNAQWLPWFWLPWAAHLCLFAAPILYLGHLYRRYEAQIPWQVLVMAALVALLGFFLVWVHEIEVIDMKRMQYGTPFATLSFALCVSVLLITFAKRWCHRGRAVRLLAYVGESSLVILFMHQAIQRTLVEQFQVENELVRIVAAVVVPTLAYALLKRRAITRALLLGSVKDFGSVRALFRSPRKRIGSGA